MTHELKRAALALGMLAAGAGAAAAQESVQTNPPLTTDQQISAQQRQIEAQQRQIDALQDQLREVTTLLSNRVERVEAQTEHGRVNMANPGPRLEGANARNSMNIIGAVHVTVGAVDQDNDGSLSPALYGGTEIKRARIGLQGTAFNDYAYAVEFDLAQPPGTSPSVAAAARDLWVQYNGFRPWSFTIGNMKPLTGLEASFNDRANVQTFAESSMMTSLITTPGVRYVGFRAARGGDHWSTALGIYGDDVNNNGVASGVYEEGFGVNGRFTWAPITTPTRLLHVGVSGYDRDVSEAAGVGQLRPRAQPENTIDNGRLIDTGNLQFAESVNLLAFETAGFLGPIGFQAEYARMDVEQNGGRPDLEFDGGYVSANWFLTGESRAYDPRTGLFTRIAPRAVMDPRADTWGAWELAARWSVLDLDDANLAGASAAAGAAVRGGEETNYTLGVNWYWNPYFRLMLNYVNADVEALTASGANADSTADLVSVRVQQEW